MFRWTVVAPHMRTILHWGLLQTSCAMSLPAAGGTCIQQFAVSERPYDNGYRHGFQPFCGRT